MMYFYENAKYLAKKHGDKMSYVEEKVLGVTPGYISRKIAMGGAFPLDFAVAIAKRYGRTLDEMVNEDLEFKEEPARIQAEIDRLTEELKKWTTPQK